MKDVYQRNSHQFGAAGCPGHGEGAAAGNQAGKNKQGEWIWYRQSRRAEPQNGRTGMDQLREESHKGQTKRQEGLLGRIKVRTFWQDLLKVCQ